MVSWGVWASLKLAVLGSVVMAVVVGGVIVSTRQDPPVLDTNVPSGYRPGGQLSFGLLSDCDAWDNTVTCTDRDDDGTRYYVSYRGRGRVITRVSKWVSKADIRLGDLILAWGHPSSTEYATVSWGNRSAFAMGSAGWSPFDKVYFVSYYAAETSEGVPWRGFVNMEPYPTLDIELPDLIVPARTYP
jgi:hypothetical protein